MADGHTVERFEPRSAFGQFALKRRQWGKGNNRIAFVTDWLNWANELARDIGVHSKADGKRGGAGIGLIVAHRERHDKANGRARLTACSLVPPIWKVCYIIS